MCGRLEVGYHFLVVVVAVVVVDEVEVEVEAEVDDAEEAVSSVGERASQVSSLYYSLLMYLCTVCMESTVMLMEQTGVYGNSITP